MLKGRKIFVIGGPFGQPLHTRRTDSTAPLGRGIFINRHQGLKPLAESCSPFGTKSDSPYATTLVRTRLRLPRLIPPLRR
jgi:hypothetical protein